MDTFTQHLETLQLTNLIFQVAMDWMGCLVRRVRPETASRLASTATPAQEASSSKRRNLFRAHRAHLGLPASPEREVTQDQSLSTIPRSASRSFRALLDPRVCKVPRDLPASGASVAREASLARLP